MACNVGGSDGTGIEVTEAKEGDTIKVQWDFSDHPGPITHFLFGPVDDVTKESGVGTWFKIDELNSEGRKWGSELMHPDMTRTFKLPMGLASGGYLLRSEMLGLHGSYKMGGGQL